MSDTSVVRTFFDAFTAGDAEAALAVVHDDVQVSEPAGLPIGGELDGKPAFLVFLGQVAATFRVDIGEVRLVDAGDVTIALIDVTWTSVATEASLSTKLVELYTVADGLITAIDVYLKDTRALYELTRAP